jgi:guanine deaminase
LGLAEELGHFGVATLADVCIWDWAAGPVAEARMDLARDPHERAFAWMTLSDDRNLVASYVAGELRYRRS